MIDTPTEDSGLSTELNERLASLVGSAPVVLFMKGDRGAPQCGFSAQVVQILDRVLPDYRTQDVLQDEEIRNGIKEFSDWPTIPQLYVGGEFQGGCDIVREMYANGELHQALGQERPETDGVVLNISDAAVTLLEEAKVQYDGGEVHLGVDARFHHSLAFGPMSHESVVIEANGIKVLMDPDSAARANGLSIDVRTGPEGSGLMIDNPNAPQDPAGTKSESAAGGPEHDVVDGIPQMTVAVLDQLRKAGAPHRLVDVRTEGERETASIEGAEWLHQNQEALEASGKDELIVFQCHHGGRSQRVAQHFAALGFTDVYNLAGGIDSWATEIDSNIKRY